MDYTCRTKTLQAIVRDMSNTKKRKIVLEHKLQRKEGQWNKNQKSDLIDSLLRKYPINPTYAVKENDVLAIIDGVQRLSTIRDYIDNKFSLDKQLEPVSISGEGKDIAGKKFSKLDEDTRDALLSMELQIYEITDYTEKDVREMFRRQNAGKPLTSGQLRVVKESDELSGIIYSLTSHPFFDKIMSKTQRKKDLDKDIAREILMLTELSNEYDFGSFKSKDIDSFVEYYNENINVEKISILIQALDKLDEHYAENIKVKQTSLPMFIYGMYEIIKNKKSTTKYLEWLDKFIETYDQNKDYLQYCGVGTANSDMVKGRLEYFVRATKNM